MAHLQRIVTSTVADTYYLLYDQRESSEGRLANMTSNELKPPVNLIDFLSSWELLRVWILNNGMPSVTTTDIMGPKVYGYVLKNFLHHSANAIAKGETSEANRLFEIMKSKFSEFLNEEIDWPLSEYKPYDAKTLMSKSLPIPPLATKDKESIEVARVWIKGAGKSNDLFISLCPSDDTDEVAEISITILRLVVRDLHYRTGRAEAELFEEIKTEMLDLISMDSNSIEGEMKSD